MRALGVRYERVLRRSQTSVDEFVIRKRREELAAAAAGREETINGLRRADLPTMFTKMHDADHAAAYMDKFLHDICVNFILGGRDTSSVALACCYWLLSKNTGVEAKIVEEIEGIVAARASCRKVNEELVFQWDGVPPRRALRGAPDVTIRPRRPQEEKGTSGMASERTGEHGRRRRDRRRSAHSESSDRRSLSQSSRCHLHHCLRLQVNLASMFPE